MPWVGRPSPSVDRRVERREARVELRPARHGEDVVGHLGLRVVELLLQGVALAGERGGGLGDRGGGGNALERRGAGLHLLAHRAQVVDDPGEPGQVVAQRERERELLLEVGP